MNWKYAKYNFLWNHYELQLANQISMKCDKFCCFLIAELKFEMPFQQILCDF